MEASSDQEYYCCFCHDSVTAKTQSHHLDPCGLVIIGNINKEYGEQKEQEFYCHFACFRKLVNNDGIMYIAESDFSTRDEIAAGYQDD